MRRSPLLPPNVQIVVNGEPLDVPDPITVADLLGRLSVRDERVAVEVNLEVVRRADRGSRTLREGDKVEVVSFVGGGS